MNLLLPQQTYQSRSKPFSSERLLNLYLETANGSKTYMLVGAPGLKEYYDFGGNERVLGMIYLRDYLVLATGAYVYVLYRQILNESTGEYRIKEIKKVSWGDLGMRSTSLPVQMVSNGDTVLALNSEEGVNKIVEIDLFGPEPSLSDSWSIRQLPTDPDIKYISLAYISGVFLAACKIDNVAYVQFTDVLDTELKYAFQLDTALSNLKALQGNMREIWAFGVNSIEVLVPTGEPGNDFFAHATGAYINKGTVCKNSIATYESNFFFYSTDGCVYVNSGYSLSEISTPALIDMINSWGTLDTDKEKDGVIGQIFSHNGHTFYMLKFKKFKKTLLFDITTGSWLERESGDGEEWEGEYVVRRPNGELIVSSSTTSKLYYMNMNYYSDDGKPICREFVFQTLSTEGKKRLFFYSLTLEIDSGLGPDDTVMLSWSNDGGYTWGKERTVSLGNYGEYNKKIQFRRLGSSTMRTFRVRMSTKSMINILRASLEVEEGQ